MTMGPPSEALAALLALTAARLPTRVGPDGVVQLLKDQPRDQWDHKSIGLGLSHLERSAYGAELTVWHLRAEIASLHAAAPCAATTDWPRIASVDDHLLAIDPSPITKLARAVAIGRAEGAAAGLAALRTIEGNPYSEAARRVPLGARPPRRSGPALREGVGARPHRAGTAPDGAPPDGLKARHCRPWHASL
jgi:RNA polymerase sigma-70 factor, ECF subfamily